MKNSVVEDGSIRDTPISLPKIDEVEIERPTMEHSNSEEGMDTREEPVVQFLSPKTNPKPVSAAAIELDIAVMTINKPPFPRTESAIKERPTEIEMEVQGTTVNKRDLSPISVTSSTVQTPCAKVIKFDNDMDERAYKPFTVEFAGCYTPQYDVNSYLSRNFLTPRRLKIIPKCEEEPRSHILRQWTTFDEKLKAEVYINYVQVTRRNRTHNNLHQKVTKERLQLQREYLQAVQKEIPRNFLNHYAHYDKALLYEIPGGTYTFLGMTRSGHPMFGSDDFPGSTIFPNSRQIYLHRIYDIADIDEKAQRDPMTIGEKPVRYVRDRYVCRAKFCQHNQKRQELENIKTELEAQLSHAEDKNTNYEFRVMEKNRELAEKNEEITNLKRKLAVPDKIIQKVPSPATDLPEEKSNAQKLYIISLKKEIIKINTEKMELQTKLLQYESVYGIDED